MSQQNRQLQHRLGGGMQETMEEPQQGPVRVLIQHPPVIQASEVFRSHDAPYSIDQSVQIPQQGRYLEQEEDDADYPSAERGAADRGVVVVHDVPAKNTGA